MTAILFAKIPGCKGESNPDGPTKDGSTRFARDTGNILNPLNGGETGKVGIGSSR